MDDRAQHGYPQPTHADARGVEQGAQTPWPSFQSPQYGAPIAGQAPYPGPGAPAPMAQPPQPQPQQPHPHAPQQFQQAPIAPQYQQQAYPQQPQQAPGQYQYAPGFVMPGAPTDAQPMSAHGGTIGMPMQPGQDGVMPMLHGAGAPGQQPYAYAPQSAMAQQPMPPQPAMPHAMQAQHPPMHGAAAMDFAAQPQQWAYPTPNGLQLVQPGQQAPATAMAIARERGAKRMKWETIVPAAAVICLLAAIGLFISDFDRITGRDAAGSGAKATSTKSIADTDSKTTTESGTAGAATTAEDVDAVLDESAKLFQEGNFEDAANLLRPMLDVASPDERVVELNDRIDAAATRNEALLGRLARQRRASQWPAVLVTIAQIEKLRPLSPSLTQLRAEARRAVAARRAAAKAKTASPSTSGGGQTGHHAPAAGGHKHSSTTVRPPATSPTAPATIPPRPDRNPVSGNGGGIGAAPTCPAGQMAHTVGGVTECMAM